jgi:hypothetical protein
VAFDKLGNSVKSIQINSGQVKKGTKVSEVVRPLSTSLCLLPDTSFKKSNAELTRDIKTMPRVSHEHVMRENAYAQATSTETQDGRYAHMFRKE